MTRRILITGAGGFVGHHLARLLQESGDVDLFGSSRSASSTSWPEGVVRKVTDLSSYESTEILIRDVKPNQIYHLAGQASVARSWQEPHETYVANVLGQLNLLEALRRVQPKTSLLMVGSSDAYGHVSPSDLPVRESQLLRPVSPYAVSRAAQDMMAEQYFRSYQIPLIRTRTFNHTGPGRPEGYAISNFASQIAKMELHLQPPTLSVGNLDIARDYLDVRDVVRAYDLAIQQGETGAVYNICSGRVHTLAEAVDILLQHSKLKVTVYKDPSRQRPADIPVMYGDPSAFQKRTGWSPQIPFEQTVQDLLLYWRSHWKNQLPGDLKDRPA